MILRWGILRFTSAAIQNRVTFVYTLEQSAGVEVLPRCVNDMGREVPATGGQNASSLHNQDHRQPTLLPSPLTPWSSLPWFADTLNKLDYAGQSNDFFSIPNSPPPPPPFCLCRYAYDDPKKYLYVATWKEFLHVFAVSFASVTYILRSLEGRGIKIGSGQNAVCPNQCNVAEWNLQSGT